MSRGKDSARSEDNRNRRIPSDNPVARPEDDLLGRAGMAGVFVEDVLSLDASEGLVVAVLGPWGSGKTSFINLTRPGFEASGAAFLDFNPWMFSGAEQLVNSFFIELAAQLRMKTDLAEIGKDVEEYGEAFAGLAWLPLVGPWIERTRLAGRLLGKMLQQRREGVGGRRDKLKRALQALETPIVVALDDVDRLSTDEIRDVFKLVRLAASFPNIIYILAFDRGRVEAALSDQGIPGRDYLEKILQIAVDLPAVPTEVLTRHVLNALDDAIGDVDRGSEPDPATWPDTFMEIITPLLRNMRDVRRYAAASRSSVKQLAGQIELGDILALEAVRLFLPDVFARMHGAVEGLTTVSSHGYRDSPKLKADVDGLIEVADRHGDVIRALIERLFPAGSRHVGGTNYSDGWANTWLKHRRVAHKDILRLYLERVAGDQLQAFTAAEVARALMSDQEGLDQYLRSLDPEKLEDVIAHLEVYEEDYQSNELVPTIVVLLNLLPDLPERHRGIFDLDTRLVVGRVVYRLVRKPGTPTEIENLVREVLPQVTSLASKDELLTDVGYREGGGHKLVSEDAASQLEREFRDELRATPWTRLADERLLLWLILRAKRESNDDEAPLDIPNQNEVTLAILKAARGEVRGQTMGSRAVRRTYHLAWDALIEAYGDEETLHQRVTSLGNGDTTDKELIELARKYMEGWRPPEFDDD